MAVITVNKYHLIAMGLYSKHLNNEPNNFSEDECKTFASAYIKDSRRPVTDYMNNIYKYDFDTNVSFAESDIIRYNAQTKSYSLKTNNPLDLLTDYMRDLSGPVISYLEILGKEKLYKVKPSEQPII